MKKTIIFYFAIASGFAVAQLPKPDHIVMAIFQNKGFAQIVGSTSAPYINSLIADTNTAFLTQSYALTHPSQPNYLMFYSGSNQGVTDDNIPGNTPFTTCNLGASLLASSKTFTGYSESMPSAGYLGASTSLYYRKHNPWSDWQGTGANNIPPSCNQPFTSFPTDYNLLPNVSIVVANIINCMHDGTIQQGDTWLQNNLDGYIQWAKTHNSLFILTFDEDDSGTGNNRITTFFIGPMVAPGSYTNHVTHFNVLRTIEDIYGLPACGTSSINTSMDFVFKSLAGINKNSLQNNINLWSASGKGIIINVGPDLFTREALISIKDLSGREIKKEKINLEAGENVVDIHNLDRGIYLVNISGNELNFNKKISKE